MLRFSTAALAFLVALSLAAAPAHAQIYVDTDANGANDGTSWTDAYTDLQTAIDNADGSSELWVAEGVYKPDSEGDSFTITGNKDGIELYGGFEGTESSRSAREPNKHRTILSGDLAGDDTDPDGDGIIEDADPNQDGTPENLSGGENAHHILVLDGGGTRFSGIGADISANITSSTVLDGLVVTAGQADGNLPDDRGGGLYCDGGGSGNRCSPTVRNVVFAGNAADFGGGILNAGGDSGTASPRVANATFAGNAAASNGGAIYNGAFQGTASPSVTNATFAGNAAASNGGAIHNYGVNEGTASPSVTNATFAGNAASDGGAIYNNGNSGTASPPVTNATFVGNAAWDSGGAIYNNGPQGTASPSVTNTILWGNDADANGNGDGKGGEIFNRDGSATLSHSIIEGGVNGSGVGGNRSNTDGGGNLDKNPDFEYPIGPAGNDGTYATDDDGLHVLPGSPAIDAGANESVSLSTDITGANRVQNGTVDIGAYEVGRDPARTIYVKADAAGGNGLGWKQAVSDLQRALGNATGNDELWVAEGVYKPDSEGDSFMITGAQDGLEIYGGFAGGETSRSARDPQANKTILSGDLNGDDTTTDAGVTETTDGINGDENSNTVLFLDGTTADGPITEQTVIDGLTITAGDADNNYSGDRSDSRGGGLYCDGRGDGSACSPTLANLVFAGNFGGALVNDAENGRASPRIVQTTFFGNRAGGEGGAIVNLGRKGGVASPHITESTFENNTADFAGGAISNTVTGDGETSPTIAHSRFRGNVAEGAFGGGGGAIYIGGNRGVASPTITHTVFENNETTQRGSRGGAIWVVGFGGTAEPTITQSVFVGNSAYSDGSPAIGGAMYINGQRADTLPSRVGATVVNSVFINNGDNHVAYSDATDGPTPALVNCTFTGATSEAFRIIQNSAGRSMTVANAIIWDNAGDVAGGSVDDPDAAVDVSSSIVEEASFVGGSTGNLQEPPKFVDAAAPAGDDGNWGTSDDGLRPSFQSPAIDRGENAALPDVSGATTDLRGAPRRQDFARDGMPTVDLGAYEVRERSVSITGGGFGGLDRTFNATPGQADQPVGVFRLTPGQSGVDLTEVSLTPDNPGVSGVDRVRLWLSDDDQFESSGDAELASTDLDPQADLPSPMTFGGFTEALPGSARYLFVTVTLTSDASGEVTGFLKDETALSMSGGKITEVNGNSQDGFSTLLLSSGASALPVEMASFEGTITENGVRLRWTTASETGNAGFRVQRRGEGKGWTKVGFVEGSGTTSEARTYRFTDTDLPYAADSVAYRLKQVDTDGSTALTDPVTVARSGPEQLELLGTAPNPARTRATLRYAIPEGTDGDLTIRLYDVMGRRVRSVTTSAEAGRHEQRLDVSGLSSGVYLLRLRADGQTQIRKLTVVQ